MRTIHLCMDMFDTSGQICDILTHSCKLLLHPSLVLPDISRPHSSLSSTSCSLRLCIPHLLLYPTPALPSSNSLPRTNPGGLIHRWVWAGLTCAWHAPKRSSPYFPPSFVHIHMCEPIEHCLFWVALRCSIAYWGVFKVIHRWRVRPKQSSAAAVPCVDQNGFGKWSSII